MVSLLVLHITRAGIDAQSIYRLLRKQNMGWVRGLSSVHSPLISPSVSRPWGLVCVYLWLLILLEVTWTRKIRLPSSHLRLTHWYLKMGWEVPSHIPRLFLTPRLNLVSTYEAPLSLSPKVSIVLIPSLSVPTVWNGDGYHRESTYTREQVFQEI